MLNKLNTQKTTWFLFTGISISFFRILIFEFGKNAKSTKLECGTRFGFNLLSDKSEFAFFGAAASVVALFISVKSLTFWFFLWYNNRVTQLNNQFLVFFTRGNYTFLSHNYFEFGKSANSMKWLWRIPWLFNCVTTIGVCVFRCGDFGCRTFYFSKIIDILIFSVV